MCAKRRSGLAAKAEVFAALGDETRLRLLAKLGKGKRHSIAELTAGTRLTRQAVTKHLRVLERVRIVHGVRAGRESLFSVDSEVIEEAAAYLETASKQWDSTLARLKSFVEGENR